MKEPLDLTPLTQSIHDYLLSYLSPFWTTTVEWVIIGVLLIAFVALSVMGLVYIERKVAAFFQLRLGPNRVGKWGLLQTLADFLKLLMKEHITSKNADKFLFNLAPFIIVIASFLAIGAIPFALGLQAMDINIGLFYITAASSIGVLGILIGGWAGNNKYSLIGALRSGAQVVSYEISAVLSLLTIVVLSGSLQLSTIIESQSDGWWIFKGHLPVFIAFIMFLIAGTAETNRGPFDLAEAESELTAGFHTEYSGIKFAMFFLAEYVNLFIIAAVGATVFLGGWMPFHIGNWAAFNEVMNYIPPVIWFFFKVGFVIGLIMWFKWTFPRLRIDQLLVLEWKYLLPINLVNLIVVAFIAMMGWYF
ncbi:MAG: NADH-quinone oxidoreductase subunit NuoH [Cyclobacteriaceae bacterium]|nr:NADH-quinone oxidoreductase subunit NuoH [Cyclobacteriaceae bacterium]